MDLKSIQTPPPPYHQETLKKDGRRNHGGEGAPSTPGRPVFSFSLGSRNKSVPSKWNDAEKWLVSHQNHNHHLQGFVKSTDFVSKKSTTTTSSSEFGTKQHIHHQTKVEKDSLLRNHNPPAPAAADSFDLLKDKFTEANILELECLEPLRESFVFKETTSMDVIKSSSCYSRDVGTEMTPLGSCTTSRCPTPTFKTGPLSPPRHNTPATRSGPLVAVDPLNIREYHLAKLKQGVSNWCSREEEEEDISKSLRNHFDNECSRKSISENTACAWEEECCVRYQREVAKIQAWVDLQNAQAEAQSRKLEMKIQKMRSKFEEKLLRKMAITHKKAAELRAQAQLEHTQKTTSKEAAAAKKTIDLRFSENKCGCFPSSSIIVS